MLTIEKDYMGNVKYNLPKKLDQETFITIEYGISVFSFLLPRNTKLSLHNFGMLINKHYDCSDGKNKAILQSILNIGE